MEYQVCLLYTSLEEETECFCFLAGHESFAAAEGAIGIAEKANKVRQKPLRVIPVSYTHLDVYKRQEYLLILNQMGQLPFTIKRVGTWIGKTGRIDIVAQSEEMCRRDRSYSNCL